MRSKLSSLGHEPHSEKEAKKKSVETQAKKQVLGRISDEIAQEATGIHEQITTAGQFVYDHYNTVARSKGMPLVDYVQQAMVFYTNFKDLIEKMESKIRDQEKTINELTEYLSPVPWRMKMLELMVAQETSGKIYSDAEIMKYLDAIDYALGKDIVLGQQPTEIVKEGEGVEQSA